MASVVAAGVAKAQCGPSWSALAPPPEGLVGTVYAAAEWDPDGEGPEQSVIALGGQGLLFSQGVAFPVVAWDGAAFTPVGGSLPRDVRALAVVGGVLHAGLDSPMGSPTADVYRLIDGVWQPLPSLRGPVYAITEFGGELIVAGAMVGVQNNPMTRSIARWDGTAWQAVGAGTTGTVNALRVFQGQLYAGGTIQSFGGTLGSTLGAWNGAVWSSVPNGQMTGNVLCLGEHQGRLVIGGDWLSANVPASRFVMSWDGVALSGYAPGLVSGVRVLSVGSYDGSLIVGGWGFVAGGFSVNQMARWDGVAWGAVGDRPIDGVSGPFVNALCAWRGSLYAFGSFLFAGGVPAHRAARFGPPACCPDVNEDGSADQGDVACLIMAVAGDASCTSRDPDFNADGSADQGDVAALIMVVAGAPCP